MILKDWGEGGYPVPTGKQVRKEKETDVPE
jgi:hypothetical protein